ncbi:MAG: sulfatase-like hydrolase/transferase [Acidobacteriota bacterium]
MRRISPRGSSRPLALLTAIVALACASPETEEPSVAPVLRKAAPGPPNVLLLYVDDLGYGDLGSYGHHTIETPHLDRLAREGLRFTNFYAPSALCSPSRAALLTGRTPFRTGIQNWIPEDTDVQLRPEEISLGKLFKSQGYATHHSGKWHLNGGLDNERHAQPDDHGFDDWITLHAFALPNQRNPENVYRNGEALGPLEGYTAGLFADATLEWLDKHVEAAPEQPFFVYFAPPEPHSMIASPKEYTDHYAHLTNGVPEPFINGTAEPSKDLEARGPGEYYANITYLDAQIGRLLDFLDEQGLTESTFVFFASDNGPVTTDWRHWWEINLYGSTGGLRGRKADLWEGGLRVPAIVRWPGSVAANTSTEALASAYDLLPTLAEIAGFAVPDDRPIDGESLLQALRGDDFERERPLYWEFDDDRGFHYALRSGRYKLHATEDLERVQLYDLEADPFEVVNIAAREETVREQMLDQLREVADSVASDPFRPATTAARKAYRGD